MKATHVKGRSCARTTTSARLPGGQATHTVAPATTRPSRWRPGSPREERALAETRGTRPTTTSDPPPPLSARGTRRNPRLRLLGGEPGKPTNQRDGHIAQAANPRGRVIPLPPRGSAAGPEAATAGVAVEAAAGAGRVALLRGAGPGWPLLAPGREGGLPGGRNGPRLGRRETRLSPGCWGGGAAAPHSSQVRGTPRPAPRPPPPTWRAIPAASGRASLGPTSPLPVPLPVCPGAVVQSRPPPPSAAPHAVAGPPLHAPRSPQGQGFRVSSSGSPAGPRRGGPPASPLPLRRADTASRPRFPAFLRAPSRDETPSLPVIASASDLCPYLHPGFAPAGSPVLSSDRVLSTSPPPHPRPRQVSWVLPFAPRCLPFHAPLFSPHSPPTTLASTSSFTL